MPGQSVLLATATDQDGLVGTTSAVLKVRDPLDNAAPVVSFDPSVVNAVLSGPTAILGTVADSQPRLVDPGDRHPGQPRVHPAGHGPVDGVTWARSRSSTRPA